MAIKDEFKQYTKEFPFVEGYLFERFMFTKYPEEGTLKYAVFYAKDNKIAFIRVMEIGKKPDFAGLKSEQVLGKEVHFGYIPSYKGVVEVGNGKTASWQQEEGVVTIILVGEEYNLSDIVPLVLGSNSLVQRTEFNEELSAIFDKSEFLPQLGGWQLVTLVFWKTSVDDKDGTHWIIHAQGNYLKEGDFINAELRFGCSHPISLQSLRLDGELDSKKLGAFDITSGDIGGESFMHYENENLRFSITTHDNLPNKAKHSKEIEELLLSSIYLLEGL